ncbi:DoxX family protein [Pollutibacter soli]|uniref:DoxX family protein n=1 Tax=Pollutibacter soli TaxID=3034157 RepID=UPI00301333EF
MKKLMNIGYKDWAFNLSMFILRIGLGALMIPHGYDKLVHFAQYKKNFINFLGMGSSISLGLVVFSEFFCAAFLIMGLFTRFAVIPLIISTSVAVIQAHGGAIFGDGEHGSLFIVGFIVILLCGPGKASLDGIAGK